MSNSPWLRRLGVTLFALALAGGLASADDKPAEKEEAKKKHRSPSTRL
jgi:hypothetical protein